MPPLFFALKFPSGIRKDIEAAYATPFRDVMVRGGWKPVPRENYHLTLHYMGDVPRTRIPMIAKIFSRTIFPSTQPIWIGGKQLYYFGKNVCYVPARDENGFLESLRAVCAPILPYDDMKEFIPHVTLFRRKKANYPPPPIPIAHGVDIPFYPRFFSLLVSMEEKGKVSYPEIARSPLTE
ncbi:MAG: 2'-5' RNA ligase family protein [Candidatus Diapherotrites archaeon]|nr:2'-5' RNA ligase family protein [Candidatus Diapherotrites archaeon]MDZ4256409.1 2'-5' RNA ligase family protein [archaeon]